jgi:hypothetical protein
MTHARLPLLRSLRLLALSGAWLLAAGSSLLAQPQTRTPRYERVHTLTPREGVFAYARISPDGKRLAYASQLGGRPEQQMWTVTVVDLPSRTVLFSDPGIDAYFSEDGTRIIYGGSGGVTVRDVETGASAAYPQLNALGDYWSWGARDGKDLILTIQNNYFYLDPDGPVLPHSTVPDCERIGTGERPLISRDGRRITTFVEGNVVVRGIDNCDDIVDTGIQGSKADFSWDGRYIAFHAVKRDATGYEIRVVDLQQRTVRTLPGLQGSAFFPSWTKDGRLSFRYDGPEYRGFMIASDVLGVAAEPLPAASEQLPRDRSWQAIFPETPAARGVRLVLVWAPWSAHSLEAFTELQAAREHFIARDLQVEVFAAADPGSRESDIVEQLRSFQVSIPRIPLSQQGLALTEARNQMPTLLLFRDGALIERRLGAQSFESLREWVTAAAAKGG